MQFTAAAFALFAAVAMIEPAQAGSVVKSVVKGVFGRDVDNTLYTRAIGGKGDIQQDFQRCMSVAKEHLKLSKGPAAGSYYLKAADGSFPASCISTAKSYIDTGKAVDGELKKNADGSYTITPKAKDVQSYEEIIKQQHA